MERNRRVRCFQSFEEENKAEYRRRQEMTPEQRMKEFEALQERRWGKDWTQKPMQKIATWETLDW